MVANNDQIPPSGLPVGTVQPRRPTLLPNFDTPVVGLNSTGGGNQSPADFLAANPRVAATATATIGGTITTGDEITIDLTNGALAAQGLSPPKISVTYLVSSTDTLVAVAEQLATLFNDNLNAQQADISADAVEAVITFKHAGPVGNLSVLTSPVGEGATVTLGGTALTGDQVNVLFTGPGLGGGVVIQTAPTTGQSATNMGDALVAAIAANPTLAGLGIIGTDTSGAVKISGVPAGDYTVTSWVNKTSPAVVVGATPDAADTLTVTFTAANLPGSPHAVSYITLPTDITTALAAAGLTAAINSDPVLAAAGITGLRTGSSIAITVPGGFGQVRYSESVTGTLSLTVPANPTTTAVTTDGETETVTFSNSGKLANGSGPILVTNNFDFAYNGQARSFFYGNPYFVDYQLLLALVASGEPIV
jgi:hypothetical protein